MSTLFSDRRTRLVGLCIALLLAIAFNYYLTLIAPLPDHDYDRFVAIWLVSFLPYFAVCALILRTKGAGDRLNWIEVGLILVGAAILRLQFVSLPPNLSHDSWRYLWDARVTLQGYSPYVYAPGDPLFAHLRDFIFENSRYRNVPTLYPPGAQAIYLLSYLLAPSNLFVLKGIFILFDLASCLLLAILLMRKGLDPARCIIYAWCPLPIMEFAFQGHVDVITITFMLLTIFFAAEQSRKGRILTGLFLGLATLTKIYPLLLLLAVVRRRDWALLITCGATILLAYLPYIVLGHGHIFGFFGTYTSEHTPNAGVVQQVTRWLGDAAHLNEHLALGFSYAVDLLIVGTISLLVLSLRLRERISMEAATLVLIGMIFAVSSHVFPWYTSALLPWIALLLVPIWTPEHTLSSQGLAIATAWYFTFVSIISYFFIQTLDWRIYYLLAYALPLAALGTAIVIARQEHTHHAL